MPVCINCGGRGKHWVEGSLLNPGYYLCLKTDPKLKYSDVRAALDSLKEKHDVR